MRAVVQRVRQAKVLVDGETVAEIGIGLLVLLGVNQDDGVAEADYLARKVVGLRIFEDSDGRMNLGLRDVKGAILAVSQFTLYGDVRKGRRPSFTAAAQPQIAQPLYQRFCAALEAAGATVSQGVFGADMKVHLVNDGPVTLLLDTADLMRP